MTPSVSALARVSCADESSPSPETCSANAASPDEASGATAECQVRSVGAWERAQVALPNAGLRFCREADTVVEGFLCNEPVVVSNACRRPNNPFDAYVCDEPRMRALQHRVLGEAYSILK